MSINLINSGSGSFSRKSFVEGEAEWMIQSQRVHCLNELGFVPICEGIIHEAIQWSRNSPTHQLINTESGLEG
jgi:hypothetical protein